LEQKLRPDLRQRHVANLVDRDQIMTVPPRQNPTQLRLMLGFDQSVDQAGGRCEDPPAGNHGKRTEVILLLVTGWRDG
jgi:hypothetical protein